MKVLAGLMLVALLAVNGSPVAAETEDDAIESAATAMIRNILGFPFVALPFELAPVDDDEVALPSPFMTGNCDPVGGVHINPNGGGGAGGGCGPADDFEPPGGGGSGGSGGGSGD